MTQYFTQLIIFVKEEGICHIDPFLNYLKNMDGGIIVSENCKNIKHISIDDRPIEMLTREERQARFERQISPFFEKMSPEEIERVRKTYRIDE